MSREIRPEGAATGVSSLEEQAPAPKAAAAPTEGHDARSILARAAVIVAASGEVPALLAEVATLEENVVAGHLSDDIAVLLLESALYQHMPDILTDEREWVRELARLAGL